MPAPSPDPRTPPSGPKSGPASPRKATPATGATAKPRVSPEELAGSAQLTFDPNHPLLQKDRLEIPGFEILGEIGRGNMGVIYKARQTKLNRIVALKMILSGKHADQTQLRRFQTEAESIGRVHHPNIVQVYNVGEYEEQPYLVMEYVDGGSLDRKLRGRTLPPKQAAQLIQTLARAIQAAHDQGIIHRDLKPGNILLTSRGVPKITDFGLAKRLDEDMQATATGTILGTPSYMAPEQARANKLPVSPATDVYGLGAILYELLTGRPPFKEETFLDTMLQVVSTPPVPPREINPKVPPQLEAICLRCLAKDPTERYLTAAALADALGNFLNRQAIVPSGDEATGGASLVGEPLEDDDDSVVDLASASASVVVHPDKKRSLRSLLQQYPVTAALSIVTFVVYLGLAGALAFFTTAGLGAGFAALPLSIGIMFLNPQRWVTIAAGLVAAGMVAYTLAMNQGGLLIAPILLGTAVGAAARGLAWALDRMPLAAMVGAGWGVLTAMTALFLADKPLLSLDVWKSVNQTTILIVISGIAAGIFGSFLGAMLGGSGDAPPPS